MSGNCCNGACGRKKPIRVLESPLANKVYALTAYSERGNSIVATTKHDVTDDVRYLMQVAWNAGYDALVAAKKGDITINPYAPPTPTPTTTEQGARDE